LTEMICRMARSVRGIVLAAYHQIQQLATLVPVM
jgi:hypothetical protein